MRINPLYLLVGTNAAGGREGRAKAYNEATPRLSPKGQGAPSAIYININLYVRIKILSVRNQKIFFYC